MSMKETEGCYCMSPLELRGNIAICSLDAGHEKKDIPHEAHVNGRTIRWMWDK